MRHLSKKDLEAIDGLAQEILNAETLCFSARFELKISDKDLVVGLKTQSQGISENGAEISTGQNPIITLILANVDIKTCREKMKQSIRTLLVHEATHFLRNNINNGKSKDIDEAIAHKNTYLNNKSEANYIAYVRCAEERPAHAAQLAMEMRDSKDIRKNPEKSWLYLHFQKRCPTDESKLKELICDLHQDAIAINDALAAL